MFEFLLSVEGEPDRTIAVDSDTVVLGADPSLPVVLPDPQAAPRHAEIHVGPRGIVLKDLATEHGTRVNGAYVSQIVLGVGDEIRIGGSRLLLRRAGAPEPVAPKVSPAPKVRVAPSRPAPAKERRRSFAVPILLVVLLLAGAGAAVYLLNQPQSPARPVAELPPAGPAPEEAAQEVPGVPDEPIPGPAEVPEEKPPEPAPEPEVGAPAPRIPVPAAAVPEGRGAADRLKELKARKRAEAARLAAIHRYERFTETLGERIAGYSFDGAIDDLMAMLEPLPAGSVKSEALGRLADLRGAAAVFETLKEVLGSGRSETVTLSSGLDLRVTGADDEGFTAKVGPAETKKKWTELSPGTVHAVVTRAARTGRDWIELSAFAALFGLPHAELDLVEAYRADPGLQTEIFDAIARRRGTEVPDGGFVLHEGRWVTPEEKGYLDRGYVNFEGKWLTHDEYMKARGFVLHEGQWLSPERYAKVLEAQRAADELAKKYMPKGLIDQAGNGAVKPWTRSSEKAPVEIKTRHYTIRTDLSREVGRDLAYTMEILNMNLKSEFGIRGKGARFRINVVGNRGEYMAFWPRVAGRSLGFCSGSEICTFYQPPMTTGVLMHEGTHQIIRKFAPACPRWLHEGLACYFECSRFTFNEKRRRVELEVGLLNSMRCRGVQAQIRADRAVPITTLIRGKGGDPYQQGWAFVYYLAKGKDGEYAPHLHEFIGEAHKKDVVERFQRIFRVRDMNVFDREWREWTLALDPRKGVSLNSNHR